LCPAFPVLEAFRHELNQIEIESKDGVEMTTVSDKIDAKQVKELREKSGAPMGDCLKALQETKGNIEDAFVVLRKRGMASAAKKATRNTNEGAVGTYIHAGGKIGVLLEVNCESDFVARTDDFQNLLKDIAMHIAASDPRYVKPEDVTPEDLEREREIYKAQAAATGKPPAVVEKILDRRHHQADRRHLSRITTIVRNSKGPELPLRAFSFAVVNQP
jgi:translation elongation factor EF-Ts